MAVQLVLSIDDAGQFQVAGPITDKVLCYGMIELAKDVIRAQAEAAQRPKLTPVLSFLNGNKTG